MRFGPPQNSAENSSGDIDVSQIGRALSRKRWFVIGPTLAALIGAVIFVNVVKPRYTAETRVLLENQENYLTRADKGERADSIAPDPEAVQSQIQLLTSRDLARRAIKSLGLQGNPEFDPLADGVGALTRVLVLFGLARDPTQLSPEERILESYFDRLAILSPTKTRVLQIEFSSRDPDLSAQAANTIAGLYIETEQEAKRENARIAAQSLGALVADLRTRVAQTEGRAEEFRLKSGLLVGPNNTTIAAQQLGDLANQMSILRAAQADAQAKAKLLREMLRQNRVGEIPDVANNELIRRIAEQRVTLRAQLALESRTLLPGHPRIKELSAQLADIDAEWRRAADRTARTLENEAGIAGARVENLTRAMDEQKKVAGLARADEVHLRELESAARLLKEELEADAAKYQEALARESVKASPADARIVQRAFAPQIPSFPKKLPIVAFATIAALVLSIGAIVSAELLSGRVVAPVSAPAPAYTAAPRSLSDERRAPSLPGESDAAPDLRSAVEPAAGVDSGAAAPPTSVSDHAASANVAGRIDAARMSALSVKVLVASCSGAKAGFDAAIELGRALAHRGRAIVVAVDAGDKSYDRLVSSEGGARPLGLCDLVAGVTTFTEAIHRDVGSRLHVIPSGRAGGSAEHDIAPILEALAQAYDFVAFVTSSHERALHLAPLFDLVLVNDDDAAEAAREAILEAGAADVFILEGETPRIDDLFAA